MQTAFGTLSLWLSRKNMRPVNEPDLKLRGGNMAIICSEQQIQHGIKIHRLKRKMIDEKQC